MAAPIFFFIVVESFFHTSSKKRLLKRLYIAALAMAIGNILIAYITVAVFNVDRVLIINYNIFLSLALGISVLYSIDWTKKQTSKGMYLLGIASAIIFSYLSFFAEYKYIALLTILIFYFLRETKILKYIAYAALSFSTLLMIGGFQWLMVLALPFMYFYNGKKGAKLKYLFYVFYPLSIWIPYFLKYSLRF